jgi:hypothetical protein
MPTQGIEPKPCELYLAIESDCDQFRIEQYRLPSVMLMRVAEDLSNLLGL